MLPDMRVCAEDVQTCASFPLDIVLEYNIVGDKGDNWRRWLSIRMEGRTKL